MSFHNERDKSGRFKKKAEKKAEPKKEGVKSVNILNVLLLDDTGSMGSKIAATVEGFNKVLSDTIEDTKTTGTINHMLTVLFGEPGYVRVIASNPISEASYRPSRPNTALWQAIVETIALTDDRLTTLPEDTKVIFTIFTDGENNAAPNYHNLSKSLIKIKQGAGWVINFVGAGSKEDIARTSGSIGIFASNTLNYENSSIGTTMAFASMSAGNTRYRGAAGQGIATNDGFFSKD